MEARRLFVVFTLFFYGVYSFRVWAADNIIIKVDINVLPGNIANLIQREKDIPLIIFGSAHLDVSKIDPLSLALGVHFYWPQSYVKTDGEGQAMCELIDLGSHSEHYEDRLGPVDGYDDLLCQFGGELSMVKFGGQNATLTGVVENGFTLYETLILGSDMVYPSPRKDTTARCCVSCDDDGLCNTCNSDIYRCDDYLRVCEGEPGCEDCGFCKPPEII